MKHSEQLQQIVQELYSKWQDEKQVVVNKYPSWEHDSIEVTEYYNPKTSMFTTQELLAFEGYVLRKLEDVITQVWMETGSKP